MFFGIIANLECFMLLIWCYNCDNHLRSFDEFFAKNRGECQANFYLESK